MDHEKHNLENNNQIQKVNIPVKGMSCASCAITIGKKLKKVEGVIDCEVNYGNEKAKIEFDTNKISLEELSSKIEPLGYSLDIDSSTSLRMTPSNKQSLSQEDHSMHQMNSGEMMTDHKMKSMDHSAHTGIEQSKQDKLKELEKQRSKVNFVMPITILMFVLMMWEIAAQSLGWFPRFFLPHELFQTISLILSTIVLFWIGGEFIKEVGIFAKYRVANMYTLVGIGTLTAYIYSLIVVLFPQIKEMLKFSDMVYFDVTIIVIGFIYLGKFMETRSKLMTGEAIEKLLNLQAKTALIQIDKSLSSRLTELESLNYDITKDEVEIKVEHLEVGDVVIVKPGSKIPIDGIIIDGASAVDESMITGEPIPVDKNPNDLVIGGTINRQGAFKFKVTKIGTDTLLAQIVRMVDEAQGSKAPIQGLADRISAIFVPAVLVISLITLLSWLIIGSYFLPFSDALSFGLMSFTGVLVIACPCALGLATPTAIIVGTGKGAENGILIKNAESLEKLHKVNIVVTDKTGTITKGKPEVTDIIINNSTSSNLKSEKDIIQIIASLEKLSEHPLAEAIVNKGRSLKVEFLEVKEFKIEEGKGLTGEINGEKYFLGNTKILEDLNIKFQFEQFDELTSKGKTPVFLATQSELVATIGIADTVKENAKDTVDKLHKLGIKVVMLTGDNKNTAKYIAEQVGIDYVVAEVLPEDKVNVIKLLKGSRVDDANDYKLPNSLISKSNVVAMVGDGVNDAPALAHADVGIAMATGTDVAIESASITLLKGDFSKVLQAIQLSKFTLTAIKQNLFWAFAYNIIGIPLAAGLFYPVFGVMLNPVFAGLAMALSSVSVVANSLRLKKSKI